MEVTSDNQQQSSLNTSLQVSNGDISVILMESTDFTDPDEFVLDFTSLPTDDNDVLFEDISNNYQKILKQNHNNSGEYCAESTKRRIDDDDELEVNVNNEIKISGYESDTEHDEESNVIKRRRKKIKLVKNEVEKSHISFQSGEKRKCFDEENVRHKRKRHKLSRYYDFDTQSSSDSSFSSRDDSSSSSSSDSMSSSSASSSSNSECSSCSDISTCSDFSSSDNESLNTDMPYKYLNYKDKVIPCPRSCVCKVGPSIPPEPIFRTSRTIQPLFKKLLQRRLLSLSNTFNQTCCVGHCYRDWAHKRVTVSRMVRDYPESDLRVDYFSWGKWKQEQEVEESASSDEDWFW